VRRHLRFVDAAAVLARSGSARRRWGFPRSGEFPLDFIATVKPIITDTEAAAAGDGATEALWQRRLSIHHKHIRRCWWNLDSFHRSPQLFIAHGLRQIFHGKEINRRSIRFQVKSGVDSRRNLSTNERLGFAA
jgi:hypothetical protein